MSGLASRDADLKKDGSEVAVREQDRDDDTDDETNDNESSSSEMVMLQLAKKAGEHVRKYRDIVASRVAAAAAATSSTTSEGSSGGPVLPEYAKNIERAAKKVRDDSFLSVNEDRPRFVSTWAQILAEFVRDPERTRYECPSGLNGEDRKELHGLAAKYNLSHHSEGHGVDRRLILTKDSLFFRIGMQQPSAAKLQEMKYAGSSAGSGVPAFLAPKKSSSSSTAAPKDQATRDLHDRYSQFQRIVDPNATATVATGGGLLFAAEKESGANFSEGTVVKQGEVASSWHSVLGGSGATATVSTTTATTTAPVVASTVQEIVVEGSGRKRVRD
eukprot:PhM_4_TR12727/c0_g1_i1/m.98080